MRGAVSPSPSPYSEYHLEMPSHEVLIPLKLRAKCSISGNYFPDVTLLYNINNTS